MTGKGLEYAFVVISNPNVIYNSNDLDSHINAWSKLSITHKLDFLTCAYMVLDKFNLIDNGTITMYINKDNSGRYGIVSDIVINQTVYLSIKNNKLYAKSQRPNNLPKQCGFLNNEQSSVDYLSKYKCITDMFYNKHKNHTYFREIDKQTIWIELYKPIYALVSNFISVCDKSHIKQLYSFLKGETNYWQVLNKPKYVVLYDFTKSYHLPTRLTVSYDSKGYILLQFNNKHTFRLRLHTASSRLTKNLSLKFDTILINQDELYPKTQIRKDETVVAIW